MTTITIPSRVTKGEELVVIPRKEYEKLTNLDKDLEQALKEVVERKAIGPFRSVKELKKSLEG